MKNNQATAMTTISSNSEETNPQGRVQLAPIRGVPKPGPTPAGEQIITVCLSQQVNTGQY